MNALATTNTARRKVDIVNKQFETTIEKEYWRLVIPQSKQQHEFNTKIEAEKVRITDELNHIKATISSYINWNANYCYEKRNWKRTQRRTKHIQRKIGTVF